MSDDGAKPAKLSASSVFERLLTYADKPWKALAVLLGVVVCGACWLIWTERARIADAVLVSVHHAAVLDNAAFFADAPTLLRETRSDLALLVEVNLYDNLMIDRAGLDTDGNRWVPTTGPQQLLLPTSPMPRLIRFLDNEVSCNNTADTVNEEARVLAAKGYQRLCMVAVPPMLGVSVGGLVVAWKTPPLPANEQRAGYAMKSAAMKFASW